MLTVQEAYWETVCAGGNPIHPSRQLIIKPSTRIRIAIVGLKYLVRSKHLSSEQVLLLYTSGATVL